MESISVTNYLITATGQATHGTPQRLCLPLAGPCKKHYAYLHTNYQDCKSMEASPRNEQEVKDLNIQFPNRTTMGSGVHTPTDPNSFVNIQDIFMALDMWL